MPYIPSPEKLQALGFERADSRDWYARYRQGRNTLTVFTSDPHRIHLQEPDGSLFAFTLPSEVFFDQLLEAVGWQPAHE